MIPYEEHDAIHAKLKTNNLMSLRSDTWKTMIPLLDEAARIKQEAEKQFILLTHKAKEEKILCYYVNGAGQLCRGYITDFNPYTAGQAWSVKMRDADFSDEQPSAFDKTWISWHSMYHIEEPNA